MFFIFVFPLFIITTSQHTPGLYFDRQRKQADRRETIDLKQSSFCSHISSFPNLIKRASLFSGTEFSYLVYEILLLSSVSRKTSLAKCFNEKGLGTHSLNYYCLVSCFSAPMFCISVTQIVSDLPTSFLQLVYPRKKSQFTLNPLKETNTYFHTSITYYLCLLIFAYCVPKVTLLLLLS